MAELKWLEDLLALMEENSFTQAAQKRFVTQPAFSRRIRQLENWLELELVERQHKPTSIHPAVREHEGEIRELVSRFYQLRNHLKQTIQQDHSVFVVQHTLAVSHFPEILKRLQPSLPNTTYRLHTTNNEDCPDLFLQKGDFMLCYEHPETPLIIPDNHVQREMLTNEILIPAVSAKLYAKLFTQSQQHTKSPSVLPLLLYSPSSFLADTLSQYCLPALMRDFQVDVICESAFAISLKQMVSAELGIAWLPRELIADELVSGQLVSLQEKLKTCSLQISLYCKTGKAFSSEAAELSINSRTR